MSDNDNNNQIIPVGKQHLTKVSKTLAITNKLIQEIERRNTLPTDDFKVFIPDVNFQNYLKEEFGIAIVDNYVSYREVKNIEKIDCKNKEIASLEGIQHFTALTTLYCSSNQLTNLDVSKNSNLINLSCTSNQLTNLDVSKNSELKTLFCGVNQLTQLDVSKNTALICLNCISNQLTELDVSKNKILIRLFCGYNQLTNLDVSQNKALKLLRK
jgi:Leucine-rich repeat (LRR) protein